MLKSCFLGEKRGQRNQRSPRRQRPNRREGELVLLGFRARFNQAKSLSLAVTTFFLPAQGDDGPQGNGTEGCHGFQVEYLSID